MFSLRLSNGGEQDFFFFFTVSSCSRWTSDTRSLGDDLTSSRSFWAKIEVPQTSTNSSGFLPSILRCHQRTLITSANINFYAILNYNIQQFCTFSHQHYKAIWALADFIVVTPSSVSIKSNFKLFFIRNPIINNSTL